MNSLESWSGIGSELLLMMLLHFVWQATVIVGVVLLVKHCLSASWVRTQYSISVAGLFLIVLAPVVTCLYYLADVMFRNELVEPMSIATAHAGGLVAGRFASQGIFQTVFVWFSEYRLFWLGGWSLGVALFSLRLVIGLNYSWRIRTRYKALPSHLEPVASRLKELMGLPETLVIAVSNEVSQAVATGLFKPMILVPAAWISHLPCAAIEAVLAHELAHVCRWDLWINFVQKVTETFFFFHPLVWLLSKMISFEREACCDRKAIEITNQPLHYLETLTQIAQAQKSNYREQINLQLGTSFQGEKRMNLLRRAKLILEPAALGPSLPIRFLALFTCFGILGGYGTYALGLTPAALTTNQDYYERDHDHDHDAHDHDHHDHDHDEHPHEHDHDFQHAHDHIGKHEENEHRARFYFKSDDEQPHAEHRSDQPRQFRWKHKEYERASAGGENRFYFKSGRSGGGDLKARLAKILESSQSAEVSNEELVKKILAATNDYERAWRISKDDDFNERRALFVERLQQDRSHVETQRAKMRPYSPRENGHRYHVERNEVRSVPNALKWMEKEKTSDRGSDSSELGGLIRELQAEVKQLRREVNRLQDKKIPGDRDVTVQRYWHRDPRYRKDPTSKTSDRGPSGDSPEAMGEGAEVRSAKPRNKNLFWKKMEDRPDDSDRSDGNEK